MLWYFLLRVKSARKVKYVVEKILGVIVVWKPMKTTKNYLVEIMERWVKLFLNENHK